MPILLRDIIQGFERLTCIERNTTIDEALYLMRASKFSQLPVVEADHHLVGVVSEHSIVEAFFEFRKDYRSMSVLAVSNCLEANTSKLTPDSDIFLAMKYLETASYVIVVNDEDVPVGIITSYDTGQVFAPMGEVLTKASEIEDRLQEYIVRAFPDDPARQEALRNAFPDTYESKQQDRLSFGDLLSIIENGRNWPRFESVFGSSQIVFRQRLGRACEIRNDIAHFRRKAEQKDVDEMTKALQWLYAQARLAVPETSER